MSESVHKTLSDATELQGTTERGHRLTSVVIAIIAVLAALGTLFSHHRSIQALTAKNQAILTQARASDAYGKYEARVIRSEIVQALIQSGVPGNEEARKTLQSRVNKDQIESVGFKDTAKRLEDDSDSYDVVSDKYLRSYEVLEYATTFFEVAIVLASVSTLVRTRAFLTVACTLSAVGLVLLLFGYLQAH